MIEKYPGGKVLQTSFVNNKLKIKCLEAKKLLTSQESVELCNLKQISEEIRKQMKSALFVQLNLNRMTLRNH